MGVEITATPLNFIDTWVTSYSPNTNYGTAGSMYLGNYRGNYSAFGLIKLKPSTIPDDIAVEKVYLKLYCASKSSGITKISARPILEDWQENIVTYNNLPPVGEIIAEAPLIEKAWVEIDITEAYRPGSEYYGVRLEVNAPMSNRTARFYTADSSTHKPIIGYHGIKMPLLGFHDENIRYYSDGKEIVFFRLELDPLFAGQTGIPYVAYLKNLCGYPVKNVKIEVDQDSLPPGVNIKLSKYQSPFIPEDFLIYEEEIQHGESVEFWVRANVDYALNISGGKFRINAQADL